MNLISFTSKTSFKHIIIIVASLLWLGNTCLSLHGEVREIIDARQMLNNENNIANCLTKSLEKGQYALIKSIISVYDQQYEQLIIKIFEKQLQRLKILQQQIIFQETTLAPVIKWGQNESHLFISIKMSHRWDSPPCLNIKDQKHRITNQSFQYINTCVVSHSKITFSLKINFYQEIEEQEITIQNGGVGIYSTIVSKGRSKVWPFLDKEQTSFQKWLEISERYGSVEKEYQILLEHILKARRSKPSVLEPQSSLPENNTNFEAITINQNESIVQTSTTTSTQDTSENKVQIIGQIGQQSKQPQNNKL